MRSCGDTREPRAGASSTRTTESNKTELTAERGGVRDAESALFLRLRVQSRTHHERAMVDPQGRVSRWGSACLGAGVIFGWASHALKRCVAPEFCGRFSPRFPPRGLGTDDGSRRAALALTFPLLSRLRTSRRDCVRLRQIPQYDDFARLERDLRALAADAPGESSRRGPGRVLVDVEAHAGASRRRAF